MAKKKTELSKREKRRLRVRQLVFIGLGIVVILTMVISLLINT